MAVGTVSSQISIKNLVTLKKREMIRYIAEDQRIYVGLEDSKKTWKICVRAIGTIIHELSMKASYPNLKKYLVERYKNCEIHIVYEAGFRGFNLYDDLMADGYNCIVTPPHTLPQPKCSKVKTDLSDARLLAKALESDNCKVCHIPDKQRRIDRQVCRTELMLTRRIISYRNMIRKFLEFHGIELDIPEPQKWTKRTFRYLRSLKLEPDLKFELDLRVDLLEMYWEKQKYYRSKLSDIAKEEQYRRWDEIAQSVPGIGKLTSIRLLLELGDLRRFHSGQAIAQFVGLGTSEYSTGATIRKGSITKLGNRYIRSWLIEASWIAKRKDPAILKFFENVLRNTGDSRKAIVAVARKLIVRLRSCIVNDEKYILCVAK